jgi:hypothetical protein
MSVKKFKSKKQYYIHLLFDLIGLSIAIWLISWIITTNEQELISYFSNQELSGSSSQRGAQIIEQILAEKWGKTGLISIPLLVSCGILYELIREIREYIRYINKEKLYKAGLVDNLDDDIRQKSIIKSIRDIFSIKKNKKKYAKKNIKKMKKDQLYKELYGDG